MSKTNLFDVAYPESEKAVTLVFDHDFPISCLFIGMTFPLSTYKILRRTKNDQCLFEFVLDGEGEIVIEKKKYFLKKGDLFVLTKNAPHDYHSKKDNPLKKIWVSFKSEYLEKMIESYNVRSGVFSIDLEKQFMSIYNIANAQTTPQNKLFAIADNIHQIITTLSQKNTLSSIDTFSAIKNYLLSSIYSEFSLEDLSSKLYMSKSNLIRIFKKQAGTTPYAFLLEKKLSVAETLLSSTDMTIKTISELLLFKDEHYFSFLFKQKVGLSPTEFRRKKLTAQ